MGGVWVKGRSYFFLSIFDLIVGKGGVRAKGGVGIYWGFLDYLEFRFLLFFFFEHRGSHTCTIDVYKKRKGKGRKSRKVHGGFCGLINVYIISPEGDKTNNPDIHSR